VRRTFQMEVAGVNEAEWRLRHKAPPCAWRIWMG